MFFYRRFKRLGGIEDIQKSISSLQDAVRLTPDGHPDKPHQLNNLGNSLLTRFQRLGEVEDIENGISSHGMRCDSRQMDTQTSQVD